MAASIDCRTTERIGASAGTSPTSYGATPTSCRSSLGGTSTAAGTPSSRGSPTPAYRGPSAADAWHSPDLPRPLSRGALQTRPTEAPLPRPLSRGGGGGSPWDTPGAAALRGQVDRFGMPSQIAAVAGSRRPSPLSASHVSRALGDDRVIIWDWDDTLMCSSAINAGSLSVYQASRLDAVLEQLLATSIFLGETYIVTNADELWVLESTRRFTPSIMPLLMQLKVVSARKRFQHLYPGDIFAWKREAFREVLAARQPYRAFASSPLNLVALGDCMAELEAAETATCGMRCKAVKRVKFVDCPSADELIQQLQIIQQDLAALVAQKYSQLWTLADRVRPQPSPPSPTSLAGYLPLSSAPYRGSGQHLLHSQYSAAMSGPMIGGPQLLYAACP